MTTARSKGLPEALIVRRHILPLAMLPVVEPDTSWGVLISDGAQSMESAPWTLIFPAGLLGVTVWCCNMLGDRLRDQVDQLSSRYNRWPAPGTIAGGTST